MASHTIPHPTNGMQPFTSRPAARVVPLLGPQVDHLFELRGLIRQAQEEERKMTAELLAAMDATGQTRVSGQRAMAAVARRTTLAVDPELFLRAVGAEAYRAMTVSVAAARRLMGEDDLLAISEAATAPTLRIVPIDRAGAICPDAV